MAPTDAVFLQIESREHPTHVAGLQLFSPPEGAGPDFIAEFYRELLAHTEVARIMRRRPQRPLRALGQWSWVEDAELELDYHVRLSALPRPGRVRELLELVSRLHGSLLDRHRPLWEFHLVEGLSDGRFAVYTKFHHALMDGVTAIHRLNDGLGTNPDTTGYPPWSPSRRAGADVRRGTNSVSIMDRITRFASEAASIPPALAKAGLTAFEDQRIPRPFDAPVTMFNVPIGGARRFAGQAWALSRIRAVGTAADATVNDVAVAMCSGALRRYLLDRDALPDRPMVAMLPVSLRGTEGRPGVPGFAAEGNAIGAILCDLATEQPDAARRIARVRESTRSGKALMRELRPTQAIALTALIVGGLALSPIPVVGRFAPPPFNLIISNVPGSTQTRYWNGARLLETYPLSIPVDGQAINITLTSYADQLAFGIVGCRRSVPHLQHLLAHLDAELVALERAVR